MNKVAEIYLMINLQCTYGVMLADGVIVNALDIEKYY